MAVPNLEHVVQAVRDSKHWPFDTKEQLCAYTQACIKALHAVDPNFGNLEKAPAQNHCADSHGRLHATDVSLYKPTGQVVDFISSSGFGFPPDTPYDDQNAVAWHEGPEGEYPESKWFAPVGGSTPTDPTDPDLEARVASLEEEVRNLKIVVHQNKERMEAINDRFDAESKKNVQYPLPDYIGRLFGITIVSRPIK